MLGHGGNVEVLGKLEAAQVHLEYLLTLLHLRQVDMDLAVEAAVPHEGAVQDVRPVGGSEDYHAAVGTEPVHLGKELVEGVLPLVVAAPAHVLAAGASHGVNLVDEHDAGSLFLGLCEEVAHAARTHAHEHFHEVRTADAEKRYVGLPRNGFGKKGLSRSGRPHEQGTFGYLAAEGGIFSGILEEIHYLHDFFLGPVKARYVLEGYVDGVLVGKFSGRFPYAEDASSPADSAFPAGDAHAAVHPSEHPHPHQDQEQGPDEPFKDAQPALGVILHHYLHLAVFREPVVERFEFLFSLEAAGYQEGEVRRLGRSLPAGKQICIFAQAVGLHGNAALVVVAYEMDVFDVTVEHHLLHLSPFYLLRAGTGIVEEHPANTQDQ